MVDTEEGGLDGDDEKVRWEVRRRYSTNDNGDRGVGTGYN
jgi:hypothetical protein